MSERTPKAILDGFAAPVECLSKARAFDGYFKIDRYTVRYGTFNGGMTAPVTREVFERGHAVAVIPYDPAADCLVLIEQFRPGPYAAGDPSPWLLEIVAGIMEDGEAPEDVAIRECIEECGARPKALEPVAKIYVSPGASSETVTIFAGWIDSDEVAGIAGLAAENEDIRTHRIAGTEALTMLETGRIGNATTVVALQWFVLNRTRLRANWQTGP